MFDTRELLLMAGIAAFYLGDTARLLYRDEALFQGRGGTWQDVPGGGTTLAGRYLTWPALLRPDLALVQLPWKRAPEDGVDAAHWQAVLAVSRLLHWPAGLMAALLLVVVPLALWRNLAPPYMLGLLGMIYLMSILSSVLLWVRRGQLGLNTKACLAIALDVIACPPFCINVARRLTLRCPPRMSGEEFATHYLQATDAQRAQKLHERRAAGDGLIDSTEDV